jgi:uncharacterized protein YndB with AHSA1/START domain
VTNESILISEVIPATPQRIFTAWMDSAEHSAFTGDEATVVAEIGGEHRAAGGYIQGRTLELNEGTRIVQSWRTTEFPPESPDSRVEITLEPTLGGTLVTLLHTDIPVGQGDRYRQGWNEYYLSRLKTYFSDAEAWDSPGEASASSGLSVDVELDEETAVGDLEPTSVAEAPTKVMRTKVKRALTDVTRGARAPGKSDDASDAKTVRVAQPAKAAARSLEAKAARPALKTAAKAVARRPTKVAAKPAAKARRAGKPAKKSAAKMSGKSTKKSAARRANKKTAKVAMRKPTKKPNKPAARGAKAKRAPARAKPSAKSKTSPKRKGGVSARSRR